MRCYGYTPLSPRHGASQSLLARSGRWTARLEVIVVSPVYERGRHFVPIRNVMPCPRCIRHCRMPCVPSLWSRNISPLLMMCIATSDELRGLDEKRASPASLQGQLIFFLVLPPPSALLAACVEHLCSCFLAAPRFCTLVVDLSLSFPVYLRRPEGLG